MFDSQQIEKTALEEVLRQMAVAVMIVKSPSGVNVLQNSQTQQMSERYLGCSVHKGIEDLRDLHDRGVFELVRPGGRVYEFEEWPIMRSLTSGEEVVEELLQRMADGTQLWLRCNSSPIYDDEGRIVAGALVVHDITEQKRAEEALREASRRIENIMESITEAFLALDREWRISYLNGQTLRRFRQAKGEELTREGLIGKNLWEVFPDEVGTMVYDKYHEAMREQKPVHFETYYPPTNAWYEANIYPSEEGLAIYSPDITERKRAEKELRESEERFRSTFEQAAVGIGHVDLEGHFLRLNQKVCEIVDYEQEELLQLSFQDITHPEDLERDLEEFRQLLAGEIETYSIEKRYIRKDSSIVWVKLTVSVVWAASGEPSYIVGVIEDITERKRAEERLEEVREAERSRIARDLHDDVLHDLSGALVEAQLLLRRLSSKEDPEAVRQAEQLLAALDRIGPRLRGVIYDLRLEAEHERPFSELLESLVELQRTIATECEIGLEIRSESLSGPLGKTGKELLRIVREALINARRHSGAKHVWVRVGSSEEKLYAEVEDDGRGFDVTREPSATSATSRGGMGIGGMRERARALGGELKVESEPGRGTKVLFELALTKEPELQPEVEEEVRILLVEDHASIREALASSFEGEGFEVGGQAGSLAEARQMLEEAQQEEIDVAVVDLGLPDGYGADLIEELREKNPQAQALVLSASLDRANTARAVEAGAAGVLNKTAHLDKVVEAVRLLRAGETLMPLEEVVELLRYAGSDRREEYEARHALEKLTPREREVLQALAEGRDSEGIAEKLHISLRTQRNHMSSIFSKLGVHSQLQALIFAVRHGVVEIP